MSHVQMKPGEVMLSEWRTIYQGASTSLDPSSIPRIAASAAAVERILSKDQPVYGINTGFGKLASVRIGQVDLATLQRNIVLSHCAGVGEPMPGAIVRLMTAIVRLISNGICGAPSIGTFIQSDRWRQVWAKSQWPVRS